MLIDENPDLPAASVHSLLHLSHQTFHLGVSLGEKVLRSIAIYLFLIIALRVAGKRELGQMNTLDLVVLLLVANAVQNGIIGNDVSVTGAIIGGLVLFGLNGLLARGLYRSPLLTRLVEGEPTELICDGELQLAALRREKISASELRAIARRQGFPGLATVRTAILETNGVITMFSGDEAPHYHPQAPLGLAIGKRRRGPESAR